MAEFTSCWMWGGRHSTFDRISSEPCSLWTSDGGAWSHFLILNEYWLALKCFLDEACRSSFLSNSDFWPIPRPIIEWDQLSWTNANWRLRSLSETASRILNFCPLRDNFSRRSWIRPVTFFKLDWMPVFNFSSPLAFSRISFTVEQHLVVSRLHWYYSEVLDLLAPDRPTDPPKIRKRIQQ